MPRVKRCICLTSSQSVLAKVKTVSFKLEKASWFFRVALSPSVITKPYEHILSGDQQVKGSWGRS